MRPTATLGLALAAALALAAPALVEAAGTLVTATGSAYHQRGSCSSIGAFSVSVDLATRSGTIVGNSQCQYLPERYWPGECSGSAFGVVECAWTQGGSKSKVTVAAPDSTGMSQVKYEYSGSWGSITESFWGDFVRT